LLDLSHSESLISRKEKSTSGGHAYHWLNRILAVLLEFFVWTGLALAARRNSAGPPFYDSVSVGGACDQDAEVVIVVECGQHEVDEEKSAADE
jgi:hypothetical protein